MRYIPSLFLCLIFRLLDRLPKMICEKKQPHPSPLLPRRGNSQRTFLLVQTTVRLIQRSVFSKDGIRFSLSWAGEGRGEVLLSAFSILLLATAILEPAVAQTN